MKQLFVDTSAWDALADKADKDHLTAIRFRNEITGRRKLVTSNYILDELFTLLLMNIGYALTIQYKARLDILIAEHVLDMVWIDETIGKEAWETFEKYNMDKLWSFTDCTSHALMKRLNITEVFRFRSSFRPDGIYSSPFGSLISAPSFPSVIKPESYLIIYGRPLCCEYPLTNWFYGIFLVLATWS